MKRKLFLIYVKWKEKKNHNLLLNLNRIQINHSNLDEYNILLISENI